MLGTPWYGLLNTPMHVIALFSKLILYPLLTDQIIN